MSRLVIVWVIFTFLNWNTSAKLQNISTELKFVKDGVDYCVENSNVPLTKFDKDVTYTGGGVRYMLGNRVNGDKIVGQAGEAKELHVAKNVQLALNYSGYNVASIAVTFVEIVFDEGVNVQNVYLVSGGIGKMNISIVVEVQNTDYLKYDVMVYGQ